MGLAIVSSIAGSLARDGLIIYSRLTCLSKAYSQHSWMWTKGTSPKMVLSANLWEDEGVMTSVT